MRNASLPVIPLGLLATALLLVCLSPSAAAAAASPDTWSALYGGEGGEEMEGVWVTEDGGFVVVGATGSYGDGPGDAWIVRLDSGGAVEWQRTYGGEGEEYGIDVKGDPGGGFIVAGWTDSFGAGKADFWVLKLTEQGDVEWQRTYGGPGAEQAWSVDTTRDGGYVVAGGSTSFGDGGVLGDGDADIWVLKLTDKGDVEWQKTYGGPDDDGGGGTYEEYVARVLEDRDGNLVVVSNTRSFGAGGLDIWTLKLDPAGDVLWQRAYGGRYGESTWMFQEATDGGYIVPGVTETFSPDESGDLWVLKLTEEGDVEWQRVYGLETHWDEALSLGATSDGGAIIGGYYEEGDEDWDQTLLRLDADGEPQWSKRYEYGWDWPNGVQELEDGGYVVAGVGALYGQDLPEDLWVSRVAADGSIARSCDRVHDIELVTVDSKASPIDTDASVRTTDVEPRESSAAVRETAETPEYLCGGPTDDGVTDDSAGAEDSGTTATDRADADDEDRGSEESTDEFGGSPGFGAAVTLAALLGALAVGRKRG